MTKRGGVLCGGGEDWMSAECEKGNKNAMQRWNCNKNRKCDKKNTCDKTQYFKGFKSKGFVVVERCKQKEDKNK